MGRKIPCKKHRGVKDPLVQQARRLQSLQGKINSPPNDPDEQPIPRSLTELFAFQQKLNTVKVKKKGKKNVPSKGAASGVRTGDNPVARLKRVPGESGREFSLRIGDAVRSLQRRPPCSLPDDAEPEDVKGERMAALRRRRRAKREARERRAPRAPRDSPAAPEDCAAAPPGRAADKRAKKAKAAEEAAWRARCELRYERVQFGDTAHAPPALTRPRSAESTAVRRGLLLAPLLAGGAAEGERARLAAVDAYRALRRTARNT